MSNDNFYTENNKENPNDEVQIHLNQKNMKTSYSNFARPMASPEELVLDFGLNQSLPQTEAGKAPDVVLDIESRIVMNYYSAKRLTIALNQILRQYESEYGTIQLNNAERRASNPAQ